MSTLFTKIINRKIPAYIIAEDEDNMAILDINPLVNGHALVIPKKEEDYYFDLHDQEFESLNSFTRKVAKSIEIAIPCLRIGVAVIGLEIPHAHIHLVPLNSMDDINFSRPKLKLSSEEFELTAQKIQEAYQSLY